MRTSQSDPLHIAAVRPAPGMGRIGITLCPGKHQPFGLDGGWARDLMVDLDAIAEWGAVAVLTLVEEHELHSLGVVGMEAAVASRHMLWRHLPIADADVPGPAFEMAWAHAGPGIRQLLRNGFDILVHCKGGLGRAGTIAARMLIEMGWSPTEAIATVRTVRPGAIETAAQLAYVEMVLPLDDDGITFGKSVEDRALGALVGLAVGDAIGTTLEFQPRDSQPLLSDMVGGGVFDLIPGEWTDDTAMALALAHSLAIRKRLDVCDVADRFCAWMEHGHYSCTGSCFDIGITTRAALRRYMREGNPMAGATSPGSAGNGSLMRLAPVVLHHLGSADDDMSLRELARRQSAITHGAAACLDACAAFAAMLVSAARGQSWISIVRSYSCPASAEVTSVLAGRWRGKHRRDISSSGYVVDSLEAAIWCVARTTSFREAVLLAANLGDDADTTAAITGQLAGAIRGMSAIPSKWVGRLAWSEKIVAFGRAMLGSDEARHSASL